MPSAFSRLNALEYGRGFFVRRVRIIGNPPVLKTGAFGLGGSSPPPSAIFRPAYKLEDPKNAHTCVTVQSKGNVRKFMLVTHVASK